MSFMLPCRLIEEDRPAYQTLILPSREMHNKMLSSHFCRLRLEIDAWSTRLTAAACGPGCMGGINRDTGAAGGAMLLLSEELDSGKAATIPMPVIHDAWCVKVEALPVACTSVGGA